MAKVNLAKKTPQELLKLLNLVKTSELGYEEKKAKVEEIENHLGLVSRNPDREKRILADINAGMADISDIN